jgi:hypothetical protein
MSHLQTVPVSPRRERSLYLSTSHGSNLYREVAACDHEDGEVYARLNRPEDLMEYRHAIREVDDVS